MFTRARAVWSLLLLASASLVLAATVKSPTAVSNHTYDYIIVGGGLAGLTVGSTSIWAYEQV